MPKRNEDQGLPYVWPESKDTIDVSRQNSSNQVMCRHLQEVGLLFPSCRIPREIRS
jgi:hypothetical protein